MTKETFVFIAGILLIITPFLGIPRFFKEYAIAGIGAILVIVGYILRRRAYLAKLDQGDGERRGETYVETTERLFE